MILLSFSRHKLKLLSKCCVLKSVSIFFEDVYLVFIFLSIGMITLVNVKAPVVATTNWWWLISALVVA